MDKRRKGMRVLLLFLSLLTFLGDFLPIRFTIIFIIPSVEFYLYPNFQMLKIGFLFKSG
ncbi:MAG: hypothetical protein HYW01_01030 [Deltaproteobacteria bacterium]|nr:hypothetical protein [Deltaproteobacteria bacterium]